MPDQPDRTIRNALDQSESRFRDLFRTVGIGIVIAGPDGVVVGANRAAREMLGVGENDLSGTTSFDPAWQAFHEDGRPCPPEDHPIQKAIATRQPVRNVVLGVFGPGRAGAVWTLVDAEPRLREDGSVEEVFCSFSDITARKQAEQALHENELRLRQMVENLQAAMTLYSADFNELLYVSPGYERIWGRSCRSLYEAPHSWLAAVHPEDAPKVTEAIERLKGGDGVAVEHRVIRPDGSVRWVSHWGSPVRDGQGRVYRIAGSIRDISARKEAEEAGRNNAERLRVLASHVPALFWTVDLHLRFTSSAGAGLEALSLEPDQVVGTDLADFLSASPDDPAVAAHRAAIEGRSATLDYEYCGRTYHVNVEPLRSAGAITGAIGVAMDTTESRKAERQAVEWKERYDAAVQATGQILYDYCVETGFVTYGGNLEQILGYTAEEMEGGLERWLELVHPDERETVRAAFDRAADTRTPPHLRYRVRTRQGRYIELQDDGHLVLDETGGIQRLVGFVSDLSERKHLEEQLRQAQKMDAVGRLAGGVAHDFNNLLTVILGYSDSLRGLVRGEEAQAALAEIESAAHRAETLTRQLLAFSRRQMLQMKVLDLNEIVAGTERMLRRLLGEHIELRTDLSPQTGRVRADASQMEQVLVNLAVNARDAMPQGGALIIETSDIDFDEEFVHANPGASPGCHVMLAVADTGTGMDDATQARIFEPFFTTKAPGRGTGLGLSMVYGTVKQSGGYISVESRRGAGTTVRIYLPRVEGPAEMKEPDRAGTEPLFRGSETILLVEDEEAVRHLVERLLQTAGYAVLTARNGTEALAICRTREQRIALMITDVVMPGLSGVDLARAVAAEFPEVKVLYMSGHTDDAIGQFGALDPGEAFLAKPFSAVALTRKIRELLDAGGQRGRGA